MISLLIDTSSTHLLVSIMRDDTLLAYKKIDNIQGLSTKLLSIIDQCVQKSGIDLSQIDTIFIVNGPGSFTGLRVGLTVAKILAFTLRKRLIPISSLEVMATSSFEGDYIIPYIDARRKHVYAGIYDKYLNVIREDSYISVENLLNSIEPSKKVVFVGNSDVDGLDFIEKPSENIYRIIQKHKDDRVPLVHEINPNYLKLTEAEEKKNG